MILFFYSLISRHGVVGINLEMWRAEWSVTWCHIADEGKYQLQRWEYLQNRKAKIFRKVPKGLRTDQPVNEWIVRESNVITNWGYWILSNCGEKSELYFFTPKNVAPLLRVLKCIFLLKPLCQQFNHTVLLQVIIFGQMDMTKKKGAVLQLYSADVPNN